MQAASDLEREIKNCEICAERFSKTHTAHTPRPVAWFRPSARILIAGQAPGMKVHLSGRPFTDPSGDRLRDWLGVDRDAFYDRDRFAILPMAFCFPGYSPKGSDLPPPPICSRTWRTRAMAVMPQVRLTLLIGGYAQKWHLGKAGNVTETVARWREFLPEALPLPHPSWRNTAWIKRNPWFETDLLPVLRDRVSALLA